MKKIKVIRLVESSDLIKTYYAPLKVSYDKARMPFPAIAFYKFKRPGSFLLHCRLLLFFTTNIDKSIHQIVRIEFEKCKIFSV